MLCKILIINMLDYKFKRFIFNKTLKRPFCIQGTAFSLYQEPPFLHFPSRLVPQEAGLYVKI